MTPFLTLESLRRIVSGCRSDLKQVRLINGQAQEKIKAAFDRERYTIDFSNRQVSKLRQEAKEAADAYLAAEKTFPQLLLVNEQSDAWSVSAYLNRAASVSDPGLLGGSEGASLRTIVALLRTQNALLSTARMTTASLAEAGEAALERNEFQSLGVIFAELQYRSAKDDTDSLARTTKVQIEQFVLPDVEEAQSLISEASRLRSAIDSTMRAISASTPDVEAQRERFATIQAEAQGDKAKMRELIAGDRQSAA